MASQDRKRVFSEAFQATPEPFSLAHRAMGSVATSIIDYSLEDTFDLHSDILCSTKENSTPIFEVQGVRREAPGIDCYAKEQFVPVAVQSRGDQPPHGYPLQDVSHQYMVGDDGPDQMLLGFDNECFSSPLPMHKTSTTVHDQAPYMSSSDLTAFWSTPPTSDYLYYNLDSNPGPVIYEDPDTIMCNGSSPINPPTPIDLHFQDLSLLELPESPLPAQPSHHKTGANRTNVFMLQSAILETYISSNRPLPRDKTLTPTQLHFHTAPHRHRHLLRPRYPSPDPRQGPSLHRLALLHATALRAASAPHNALSPPAQRLPPSHRRHAALHPDRELQPRAHHDLRAPAPHASGSACARLRPGQEVPDPHAVPVRYDYVRNVHRDGDEHGRAG